MFRSFTLWGYDWLYERRVIDLDWSSPVTWWVAALGVDLGYYWFHRATHGKIFVSGGAYVLLYEFLPNDEIFSVLMMSYSSLNSGIYEY